MALSRAELASRVLLKLGAIDPGENPTPQETADVVEIMESVFATMQELGHIEFSLDNIPARYRNPFIVFIAWHVAPDFGLEGEISEVQARKAEKDLIALRSRRIDSRLEPVRDF